MTDLLEAGYGLAVRAPPSLRTLRDDTRGLSVVEYAILALLVAVIGLIAWNVFGDSVEEKVVLATSQVGGVGAEGARLPSAAGGAGGAASAGAASGRPDEDLQVANGSSSVGSATVMAAGGGETHAAGIVQRSSGGGGSVYVAPGTDDDDSGVWLTLLGVVVLFLLSIVFFGKLKGRAAR